MQSRFNGVEVPDHFQDVVIPKSITSPITVKVVFADYYIKPFEGFDFHEKWNNGVPPFSKTMYGNIIKETEGMWYMEVHSATSTNTWRGWCPKKSCTVVNIKENV